MADYLQHLTAEVAEHIKDLCVYEVNGNALEIIQCSKCNVVFHDNMAYGTHEDAAGHHRAKDCWTTHCHCNKYFHSFRECFIHYRVHHQFFNGQVSNVCNTPTCREKGRNFPTFDGQ